MTFQEAKQKVTEIKPKIVRTQYNVGSKGIAKVLSVIPAPKNCDMFMYLTDYWNINESELVEKYPDDKYEYRATLIISKSENGKEIIDYSIIY